MKYFDFRQISEVSSSFSELFLDFLDSFPKVETFFDTDFRNQNHWQNKVDDVLKGKRNRQELVRILRGQNRQFQSGIRALNNVDLLLDDKSVAIVTGQQLGLYTGPLYTILKIIHTIKLSENLSRVFPDNIFVPVFWLEGEDHDYKEVSTVQYLSKRSELVQTHYPKPPGYKDKAPIQSITFDSAISQFTSTLFNDLPYSEYAENAKEFLLKAYSPGSTFVQSFVFLVNELLGDTGLVFLDPSAHEFKKLLAPVFKMDLQLYSPVSKLIIEQSDILERKYHAQFKPQAYNTFILDDGGRYGLSPDHETVLLKGANKTITKTELLRLADLTPAFLSPNVALRTLCQDFLLPTLAYVAGPSEIAYHAQVRTAYRLLNLVPPILVPRVSATLVEENVEKVMERFGLDLVTLLFDQESARQTAIRSESSLDIDALLAPLMDTLEKGIVGIGTELTNFDKTLSAPIDKTRAKVRESLEMLKVRAKEAQKRKHDILVQQVNKAVEHLIPGGELQERQINLVYFLAKYGLDFPRWLMNELKIEVAKHQILQI